jgi:hypothetical protein
MGEPLARPYEISRRQENIFENRYNLLLTLRNWEVIEGNSGWV